MVFRVFKTQLGKLFLFLIFVSVGGLYFVVHKVTMIRDYYQYLVEEEQHLQEQMSILREFGAQLDKQVDYIPKAEAKTLEPNTNYMDNGEDAASSAPVPNGEVERLREKDHLKLSKVLESLKSLQKQQRSQNCATSEPNWESVPKLSENSKILIPVLTYGPNNQLRGFRSVRIGLLYLIFQNLANQSTLERR